jgi:Mannosyl-glycoprotein endo-beta-N-acetylglucosaminidase
MRIIGPPSATFAKCDQATSAAAVTFNRQIFPILWYTAVSHGIDPVGVIAQAWKETGRGEFRGLVPVGFFNTCGLKWAGNVPGDTTGEARAAHARFATWDAGALAHVQHVCAYAGQPLPENYVIVDPRYFLVNADLRLSNWHELGTRWAPSPTYGDEIERTMGDIHAGRVL